ncbi:cation:proton antiporter [Gammaproteobacteria bacterium]|nr:cation:proton antiporter [Gammaproteobacteria bacterium]
MDHDSILFSIFLIFSGAALVATLALYARQALIVGYIVLGAVVGPWGLGLVDDSGLIQDIAQVGIIFLLFLLGLNLYPQKLIQLLRETTLVTLVTSVVFAGLGGTVALIFGYSLVEALVIGIATMFSSTIISLKLLPTTVLHHRHTGEVIISVLLLQDVIAIISLLVLQSLDKGDIPTWEMIALALSLPLLILLVAIIARFVLLPLFRRFDKIQEYVFLLAIGWCLGIAQLADALGLSYEIGAFIAGVAIATNPISRFIADSLRPIRDFFLVMFFFALGAGLNMEAIGNVLIPAALLALLVLLVKPLVFKFMLTRVSETERLGWETGWRLGQMSEFSLLIAVMALQAGLIASDAAYLIQVATLITFIGSSYLIVLRYPTPIGVSDRLRRD